MGRRALTAQEKAERQRQRQEALRAKQTLELAQVYALDPYLFVVIDRPLPASSASQTITATIASTPSEPPNLPGQSTAQQDREAYSSPLIAELSALVIGGDSPTPPGATTHDPTDFSPAQASSPPPSPIRHDKYHHDHNSPSDGTNEVSSPKEYYAMQPVTPLLSSPSLFHQHDH
ncbi:hypothetical protein DER46DRAFT_568811 [Fusarium sp. MPI-SDFR-AT-0072]|nr:hypothetical protein DER46DRAFT_568811 [Fusarium sp. MPI-SDFR-AT-0072]